MATSCQQRTLFIKTNHVGHTSYTILKTVCGILGLVHNIPMNIRRRLIIKNTNAEHDPMSYNEGPGIVSKDVLREPNLNMMKDIADGILNERSLMGAKFYTIDLGNDKSIKKGKGYFLPDSKLNDLVKFQSRKVLINYDHVNDLAQYIDAANGNLKTLEEQTGQKLLVVILRDVLHEGRMVDLVIGGNHTLLAIEKS